LIKIPTVFDLLKTQKNFILAFETKVKTYVSSGCWGEDSNRELADAAHFHVASSAFLFLNIIFSYRLSIFQKLN
jgi:hypothetical protein